MKTSFVRAALAVCLLGSACIAVGVLSTATVAIAKPSGPTVSTPVAKLLQPASKAMEANDFAGALALIKQAEALPDQTAFDTYKINEFLGNVAIHLNDHPTACVAFEAMADSPALSEVSPEEKATTLRIAALLATEAKHYDKGIKYGNAFIALGGAPDDLVLSTVAEAYYYLKDYANAEITGKKAIAATPAGKTPNRSGLEVVFGSQLKQNNQAGALQTLELIVTNYDDPDEWGQFIDVNLGTKGIKDIEALFLYRLRIAAKATASGEDYSVMAALALSIGYPVEAQTVLEKGLATGKLSNSGKVAGQLADARGRAAKDRASIASFDSMATKSGTGELDIKLAETYFGYGRYADAVTAAQRELGKGGPKADPNEANMVIGMALAMQGKNAEALAAFNNVKNGSAATMNARHVWSAFVSRKYAAAPTP